MRFYPVFIRLEGRHCVVVGGGAVAERKVLGLRQAGARVTVVSPEVSSTLQSLSDRGEVSHLARGYVSGDLRGADLAFAATDDEAVQGAVVAEAEAEGVLLNVVDRAELCSFIAPAVVQQGDLTVAISTAGASPLMARRLRERFEAEIGPEYAEALSLLRDVRRRLTAEGRSLGERERILGRIVDSPMLERLRRGDRDAVDRLIADALAATPSRPAEAEG